MLTLNIFLFYFLFFVLFSNIKINTKIIKHISYKVRSWLVKKGESNNQY